MEVEVEVAESKGEVASVEPEVVGGVVGGEVDVGHSDVLVEAVAGVEEAKGGVQVLEASSTGVKGVLAQRKGVVGVEGLEEEGV